MKILLIISIIINSNISISQNKLYLGKKKFFNKTSITSRNFNKISTAHKKIYFKLDKNDFESIGIYGKKIEPHLKLTENKINMKFDLFKKNKLYSQVNLLTGLSFFSIWLYKGITYNLNTGNDNITQFVFKNKQYLYLFPSLVCFSGSFYFNIQSAKKLKQCININNKLL